MTAYVFFNIPGASSPLFTETPKFAESLPANELSSFLAYVDCAFQKELAFVPPYLRRDPEGLRTTWLSEHCSEIMQKFLRSRQVLWKPEVRPEDLENPEIQSEARGLLVLAQNRDMTGFDSFLEESVRRAYNQLASFVKKKYSIDQFRSEYVPGEFYTVLRQFLHAAGLADSKVGAGTLSVVTKAAWEPEVRPEDLDSPAEQAHASELLLRAQRCDMDAFLRSWKKHAVQHMMPQPRL